MLTIRHWLVFAAMFAAVAMPARVVLGLDNSDCFACHNDKELVKETKDGKKLSMFVDEAKFNASIHGKLQCTGCHADIKEVPHEDRLKPVSCSQCHRIETDIYLKSDHGQALHKGVSEAASCQSCHGKPHELLNYRDPASPVNRANIPVTCGQCHSNREEMEKYNLRQRAVVVTYDKSVHGLAHNNGVANAAVCSDCHGTHDLHRGSNPASKLYWQNIPDTCGKCHDNVRQTYDRSIHGQAVKRGERDAPTCTDCHGEHTITSINESTSKVSAAHIPETCAQCHGAERIATRYEMQSNVVDTYMKSYHGLAMQFGGVAAASCASCHGFHDILPSSDPMSSINKANLAQTCGKCHPAIGTRLAQGEIRIHEPPGAAEGKHWLVNFIANFYIVIIVLTIGGMLAHNGLDYFRKARNHVRAVQAANDGEMRLTRIARFQHFSMIILFVVLAYTGFVHKFPDAMWSKPFNIFQDPNYVRGLVHRMAGWAFVVLVGCHLVALFCSKRGREYLQVLWVARHDLTDMLMLVRYNLGLGGQRPPHRKFNYIEKAEYWALIWGSVVMIVTGVMLVFTETVLRLWPKVWHDAAMVIHYYEAVLATLAIVVWHFYWVIFDPAEYPMNPAWLIGKKAPHNQGATTNPGSQDKEPPSHEPPHTD
jgi:cytochrome b subunit of formate dehydrogenase